MIDIFSHVIISLLVGFSFWYFFDKKNSQVLITSLFFALLSGVFVDLDHLFDYVMAYGFQWDLQKFFAEDYFTIHNYVLFHGFEYVFLFGLLTAFTDSKTKKLYYMILATSLFLHLAVDIVISGSEVKNYFLIYRILTGFSA